MNRSTRTLLTKQERTVIGLLLHADPARWFSAAAMERESSGRISRAWARVAAERLSQRGFLEVRAPRCRGQPRGGGRNRRITTGSGPEPKLSRRLRKPTWGL